jgi:hypothetical protein
MKEYLSSEKWFICRDAYIFSKTINEVDNLENAMELCESQEKCFAIIKSKNENIAVFKLVEKSIIYRSKKKEIVWSKIFCNPRTPLSESGPIPQ